MIGASLLGLTFLAWIYLFLDARRMQTDSSSCCVVTNAAGPSMGALPALFVMWSVMMIAMMLPSALPMALTFAAVSRKRRADSRAYVPLAIFVAGYLVVWSACSALLAAAQWQLHRLALLSSSMTSTSAIFAGVLLVAAGVFQFTPLKRACLARCRSPFEFIMTRWREGRAGALRMGLEHGAFCAGCCWALMLLLFALGVMNLLWVAALTALVCIEKMLPARAQIRFATGALLLACGAFVLAR